MKKLVLLLFIFLPFCLLAQQMNIISFNIRYNNPNDGENAWPNRIEMVTGLLNFHDPDIFGLQEALFGQIKDIEENINGYEWFGTGRDDGDKEGEFSPIFFRKDNLFCLKTGNSGFQKLRKNQVKDGMLLLKELLPGGNFNLKLPANSFLFLTPTSIIGELKQEKIQHC